MIPMTPTKGLSVMVTHSTSYTVFMDFDNIQDQRLDDELIPLQELFRLGDFHVFKTSEFGRHAICIDERLQSQAHAMFLQAFYGVKVRLVNPDGNDEIEIQTTAQAPK
jgi:hypothetical protein